MELSGRPAEHVINLYPRQHEFVWSEDRFTAFIGGIGSGKSYAGAVKALLHCDRPSLGLVVAPTYRMLYDATWRTYRDVAGPLLWKFNKTDFIARIGRAEVLFRSADEPDKLRAINAHWAHVDEASLCPAETYEIVMGRLRAGGEAGPLWLTFTPKGRAHWTYRVLSEMTVFRAATRDNPYLAEEFVESLERIYAGDFARQELLGEFVSFEGLVYDEFDRSVHVRERDCEWKRVVAGVDAGYTNPSVVLVAGVDGDDRVHVLDEYYRRRVLQSDFVADVKRLAEEHRVERFFVDPSAAGLIAEMRAAGLAVSPAQHDVMAGIMAVKGRLRVQADGLPRLTLSPRCVNAIAEFESYVWSDKRARDEPLKQNDHAMDALRYLVMSIGRKVGI